jgi:hypothetical protein
MADGGSDSIRFAQQKMIVDAVCGTSRLAGHNDGAVGVTNNPVQNQTGSGNGIDSAKRDFDVQMKAKQDYQKQQIPGFITHEPTDAQERNVYKQEMNRQKILTRTLGIVKKTVKVETCSTGSVRLLVSRTSIANQGMNFSQDVRPVLVQTVRSVTSDTLVESVELI